MRDTEYLLQLFEIASLLNKEFSLPSALRTALAKTIELFELQTGWIWLADKDLKSVYLAASFNLPPALREYPERLSGWCYCIDQYLEGSIDKAENISEITCTRLKDVTSGTKDLKFHATIPIITDGQKVGLINLLSREKQELGEQQLSILSIISELIGAVIQRTRLQESFVSRKTNSTDSIHDIIKRIFDSRLTELIDILTKSESQAVSEVQNALRVTEDLRKQLALVLNEIAEESNYKAESKSFQYPASPLTKRELEVLNLVRIGNTNNQIAEQLYISERTVKFHVTSILSKLFAKTRTQAVDIALKRGLISA